MHRGVFDPPLSKFNSTRWEFRSNSRILSRLATSSKIFSDDNDDDGDGIRDEFDKDDDEDGVNDDDDDAPSPSKKSKNGNGSGPWGTVVFGYFFCLTQYLLKTA